jgi:hypothetical protein
MGYHKRKIKKGVLGQPSKIREEFEEFEEALEQNNHVMAFIELSDMLGAMESYVQKYHLSLQDLITMKNATQSAFIDGDRT